MSAALLAALAAPPPLARGGSPLLEHEPSLRKSPIPLTEDEVVDVIAHGAMRVALASAPLQRAPSLLELESSHGAPWKSHYSFKSEVLTEDEVIDAIARVQRWERFMYDPQAAWRSGFINASRFYEWPYILGYTGAAKPGFDRLAEDTSVAAATAQATATATDDSAVAVAAAVATATYPPINALGWFGGDSPQPNIVDNPDTLGVAAGPPAVASATATEGDDATDTATDTATDAATAQATATDTATDAATAAATASATATLGPGGSLGRASAVSTATPGEGGVAAAASTDAFAFKSTGVPTIYHNPEKELCPTDAGGMLQIDEGGGEGGAAHPDATARRLRASALLQLQEGTPCADAAALRAQLRDEEEAEAMRAGPAASGTSGYIPSRTFT